MHPFNDAHIIAGRHGLLELLEDVPETDVVIAGIGGGGWISGLAAAVRGAKPDCRLRRGARRRGRRPQSLDAGRLMTLDRVDTIADGWPRPSPAT